MNAQLQKQSLPHWTLCDHIATAVRASINVRLLEAITVSHAAEIMSVEGSRRHSVRPQSVCSPPVIV